MKTLKLALPALVIIFFIQTTISGQASKGAGEIKKPVISKPVIIDAAKFPGLQAAFDAVPAEGGEVIIPPGEYRIEKPLILISENTYIKGSGPSTHIINMNSDGEPALIIRPKDSEKKNTYVWRIQLSDFRVSGNENSGDGIALERVDELYISGLLIDHNGRHGIYMNNCYENPRINHCNITYNKQAGMYIVGCHDVVVNANQFEENQDGIQFINSFNLALSGNNIDDHLRHGVVIENTYACVLSGNMIEECNGTAIILDRDCVGITISANVIAHTLGGGVELRDAWGCTLSANTFVIVYNFSVLSGSQSGRNIISGNSFCNTYMGNGLTKWPDGPATTKNQMSVDGGTGIILQGTSDTAISGNIFAGLDSEAVKADDSCKRIMITGNFMTDLSRRSTGEKIAIDLGNSKDNIVKDNVIGEGLSVK